MPSLTTDGGVRIRFTGSDLPSTPLAMGPAPAATALGVGFPFLSGFCFADTNSDQIQIRLLFRASSLVFPWSGFYLVIVERSLPVPVSPMGEVFIYLFIFICFQDYL